MRERVEVRLVAEAEALDRVDAGGEGGRPAVDALGDRPEALGAVPGGVHAGDDREEDLGGADVRGRLLAPDVLLAGLERQPVGGSPVGIDGHAHEAAREGSLEGGLCGHERRMWPAVAHRDAEPLAVADDDVGALGPGALEDDGRQRVGGDDDDEVRRVGGLDVGRRRPDGPRRARVRQQDRERALAVAGRGRPFEELGRRGDDDLDVEWHALVRMTAIVWGWVSSSTRTRLPSRTLETLWARVTASAAAVPSSRSEALAISMPVRSQIAVWKLMSASRRPWAISGW